MIKSKSFLCKIKKSRSYPVSASGARGRARIYASLPSAAIPFRVPVFCILFGFFPGISNLISDFIAPEKSANFAQNKPLKLKKRSAGDFSAFYENLKWAKDPGSWENSKT